ncbi:class I SAM-dependent DNA methyltransferase [Streptosporangium sp. NPDC049248]|uniref:class I SAM-dependent DNA methyltransferase n=1 Tax=Streptosporangium sp. NPDC049248 TaxID=3155651 RepID=UPI00342F5CE3
MRKDLREPVAFYLVDLDEHKSKIDKLWHAFWAGGLSNPLELTEQLTYLIFIQRLDDLHTSEERQQSHTRPPVNYSFYTPETDNLRWSRIVELPPETMFTVVRDHVFPWLRSLAKHETSYTHHLKDARFTIPNANVLVKAVDLLESLPFGEGEIEGDLYEYMLSKIADAAQSGHFYTPRHIAQLMVEMLAPGPQDEICDPACGTAGFLVAAAQYVARNQKSAPLDASQQQHFSQSIFHGFDFDSTMLRLGSMNMMLHGIDQPDIRYRDSLVQNIASEAEKYSLIITNPPFGGTLDFEPAAEGLQKIVSTKRVELLFLAQLLSLLRPGGRAAVIVPDGVLFGLTKAHKEIRRILVDEHRLDGVVKLPSGVFSPYSGISTSILFFTKTNSGDASNIWFYEVTADGFSLDGKRIPLLAEEKIGIRPKSGLRDPERGRNDFPDLLERWAHRNDSELQRKRSERSFCVPREEIVNQGYNLSFNNYREIGGGTKTRGAEGWRLGDFAEVLSGGVLAAELEWDSSLADLRKEQRVLHPSLLRPPLPSVEDLPLRATERDPRFRLREGDIVGRDLANARNWTVLPGEYEGIQAGQGILVIRITKNIVPAEYVATYLSTPQAEERLPRYGTIPRIKRKDLDNLIVPACDGDFESIRLAVETLNQGVNEVNQIQDLLKKSRMEIFEDGTKADRRIRLDQAADRGSIVVETLRKHTEPYRVIQETYPYPIARAVRKFRHSQSPAEKHEAAIQCAEALIISLGMFSLAIAAHRSQKDLEEIDKWASSVKYGGASVGHWVGVVRAVGNDARRNGEEAAGLAEATVLKKGGKGLVADINALANVRNKIRHGGGPRTRAEAEASLVELEPHLFSALTHSAFLAKSKWVYADRLSWHPRHKNYRISGLLLMGDHPDFEPIEFKSRKPLADDSLYIQTQLGEILPLFPFCILANCPICLVPEIYYPDKISRSIAKLKSIDRGHDLDNEAVFDGLSEFMG